MSSQSLRTGKDWFLRVYRNAWTREEITLLRQLAEQGISRHHIATALHRSEAAVRNKALMHGISLKRSSDRKGSGGDETARTIAPCQQMQSQSQPS
jgi:hypothetical protein